MKKQFVSLSTLLLLFFQVPKGAEHLHWCRWCPFVKSISARIRQEGQVYLFEKEATSNMTDFRRSKSFKTPTGFIWCTACNVVVENTVSGVSNHSNSMFHNSKSGVPFTVLLSNSVQTASKTSVAAAPQLSISTLPPEVQKHADDEDHGFPYGGYQQSGTFALSF